MSTEAAIPTNLPSEGHHKGQPFQEHNRNLIEIYLLNSIGSKIGKTTTIKKHRWNFIK